MTYCKNMDTGEIWLECDKCSSATSKKRRARQAMIDQAFRQGWFFALDKHMHLCPDCAAGKRGRSA